MILPIFNYFALKKQKFYSFQFNISKLLLEKGIIVFAILQFIHNFYWGLYGIMLRICLLF